jgi:hypothetical protein
LTLLKVAQMVFTFIESDVEPIFWGDKHSLDGLQQLALELRCEGVIEERACLEHSAICHLF